MKKSFDEFLKEMINLNILEIPDGSSEKYEFTTTVYYAYFLITDKFSELP